MSRRTALAGAATLGLVCLSLTWLGCSPAYAVDDVECRDATSLDETYASSRQSRALDELDLADAHAWLRRHGDGLGAGVEVAVIDSGVGAPGTIKVVERPEIVAGLGLTYYHGTAVAGLVTQVAPDVGILDLAVYDDPSGTSGTQILSDNVVKALDIVLDRVRAGRNVRVVNISLNIEDSSAVQERITDLWEAGVVTVAPTGNRQSDEGESVLVPDDFDEFQPGENAVGVVHPAAYDHVLAVNASMSGTDGADPHAYVLENSATDLAAPTAGGVSATVNGGACLLTDPATSWAAAEVSGVLALLFSHFRDDTADQAVARLLVTADGRPDVPNRLLGAGEVQPYDALTRPLDLKPDGTAEQTESVPDTRRHVAPEPEPDLLADVRDDAVWWGLLGGGAVVLALVLRPVFSRRGTPRDTPTRLS